MKRVEVYISEEDFDRRLGTLEKEDDFDTGAWEYLIHILAEDAGLCVPEAKAQKFSKSGTTFLCRRFDRAGACRIPFASAMTMLGCEDRQEDGNGTYIDIAGFLMLHGGKPDSDLPELLRRMVFSLLVSNTDDHLRNHGFVAENGRWRLSPAYDLNANAKRPQSLSLELYAGVPIETVDTLLEHPGIFVSIRTRRAYSFSASAPLYQSGAT